MVREQPSDARFRALESRTAVKSAYDSRAAEGLRIHKEGYTLVFDREPALVLDKQGEPIGVDAWLRLYDAKGQEVPIDPHRVILNPPLHPRSDIIETPIRDYDPLVLRPQPPVRSVARVTEEGKRAAFYEALWDSVLGTPHGEAWERAWRTGKGTVTTVYATAPGGAGSVESGPSSNYSTTRSGTSLAAFANHFVGQLDDDAYLIYEAFVIFNTSGIGDDDEITSVVLSMYGLENGAGDDFNIIAASDDYDGGAVVTGDWNAGSTLAAKTTYATFNGAEDNFSTGAYNVFASAGAAFNNAINKTGNTALTLYSNRHAAGNVPDEFEEEYVGFTDADASGTTQDPKLVITHESSSTLTPKSVAGSLPAPVGILKKLQYLAIAATFPAPSGNLQLNVRKLLSGALPTPVGHVSKLQYKTLEGSLPSPTGTVSKLHYLDIAALFPAPTGTLDIAQARLLFGILPAPTGHLTKQVYISIDAALPAPSGQVTKLQYADLTGTLPAPDATLVRLLNKKLTGLYPAPSATLLSQHQAIALANLAGTIALGGGVLSTQVFRFRTLEGSLPAPEGSLFSGVIAPITGLMPAPSGDLETLTKRFRLLQSTLTSPIGNVYKGTSKLLEGLVPAPEADLGFSFGLVIGATFDLGPGVLTTRVRRMTLLPVVNTITKDEFLERLIRSTGIGQYGTVTGGTSSQLIDTQRLLTIQNSPSEFKGAWVYANGSYAQVSNYIPSSGTLELESPISGLTVGVDYFIIKYPQPFLVLDTIDQALKNDIWQPTFGVATEQADGNMESEDVDLWTGDVEKAVGGEFNLRHLQINSGATTGYPINVVPGNKYYVNSLLEPNSNGATLTVKSYPAADVLKTNSVTNPSLSRVETRVNIPDGVTRVVVEITAARVYDVIVYREGEKTITLPTWVHNRDQVAAVYRFNFNQLDANQMSPYWQGIPVSNWNLIDDGYGRGVMRLTSERAISHPLYIIGTRNENAWGSIAKAIDENYLTATVAWRLFEHLKQQPHVGVTDATWINNEFARWHNEALLEQGKQLLRLEKLIETPPARTMYYSRFNYGVG